MPMPYAHGGLCPMPARAPHVTEKGYTLISKSGFPFFQKFNFLDFLTLDFDIKF